MRPEDVRPVFALALEALEDEGKIPFVSRLTESEIEHRVREIWALADARLAKEGLAELRRWLVQRLSTAREGESGAPEMSSAALLFGAERHTVELAIEELDRIAAKSPAPTVTADRLKSALQLQGTDLGPDATEAVVKALESLEIEQ